MTYPPDHTNRVHWASLPQQPSLRINDIFEPMPQRLETTLLDMVPFSADATNAAPTTRIGQRFRIVSLLGSGGMGDVYCAYDEILDEWIALKMLRSLHQGDPLSIDQLKREVKLSRKISHPNVARVFDMGEDKGTLYLTMEYIQGHTLAQWLQTSGNLGIHQIVWLIRQLCEGLEAAHRAQVVHRDIKPSNIMITSEGRVVLTDFGIATTLAQQQAAKPKDRMLVGSLGYMAPEQIDGDPSIDHRADIYALGVIMYEMLSGKRLWAGNNPANLLYRRLHETIVPLRTLSSEIPEVLSDLVERCLANNPRDRFPTVKALSEMLLVCPFSEQDGDPLGQLASPTSAMLFERARTSLTPSDYAKRIAILPLVVGDGVQADPWESNWRGDLADMLSSAGGLLVCSRGAVENASGLSQDILALGRHLRVDAILNGSLEALPSGELCLVLRLHSVQDGFQLWAKRTQADWPTFFVSIEAWSDEIARVLNSRSQRRAYLSTEDPVAIELYARGRHFLRQNWADHFHKAIEMFHEALLRVPDDPLFLSFAAIAHARRAFFRSQSEKEQTSLAWELVRRALDVAPSRGEGYFAQALLIFAEGRWSESLQHLQKAIELSPLLSEAYEIAGRILLEIGPLDLALAWLERAYSMEPRSPMLRWDLVRAYALSERWEEADRLLALEVDPQAYWFRAFARARIDLWRTTPVWLQSAPALEAEPSTPLSSFVRSVTYVMRRMQREHTVDAHFFETFVEERSRQAEYKPQIVATNWRLKAEMSLYLDDTDSFYECIESALRSDYKDVVWLEHCPLTLPLRAESRFLQACEQARRNLLPLPTSTPASSPES